MKRRHTITYLTTTLLLLSAVFACQAAWAQENSSSYQMSVVLDRAYGDVVSRGNYKGAILRINSKHSRDAYASSTNLCVAHTMVGQYKHAEHFCDKALAEAEKAAAKGRRKSRDYTGEWAMAYSNRGVLRARIGDHDGATEDFQLAMEKQSQSELPVHNLAVLKLDTTDTLALETEQDENE